MVDVGAQINHYKVVEHIGRGGMADVWSARDARLNRMVAIKTIAPGLNPQDDPVSLFKREAQTIAQMEHPHILPIYDFGDYQGMLYIVMRFVTGGSLGDRMELGRLPLEESLRLGKAVARALDYAHENNVIHLDLKPQNVLLDGHDSPYLADFGLAARADPSGRAQNPGSGTMIYMPPEQFVADTVDKRADLYSFALMMYHLLTGDLPFDMPLAFRQMQFHDVLPALPDYADGVTEVLRRGTSEEPGFRPESAQAIMQELEAALAGAIDLTGLDAPFAGPVGFATDDANLREAVDIYTRAHHAWAGGQGRFLLGVTHFMLMNDYYLFADRHGLEIDLEGRQMLLRGALEYDRDIEHWWDQLDDSNRRWVSLHAVRSENPPARVRALQRLESLPDSEPLRIPRLVAQALQVETDEQAQLAEL
ncbi:MAG TPA: serine/threonine-protein kinase, partial [Aggregatilineales bacterium]|nr:serine/threonine-protein kinase [Aggregatilineales bacterium]